MLACGWSSPAAADDRAPLTIIRTEDLAAQLPALDAKLQQAASVEQERDAWKRKAELLAELVALKDEIIAAKNAVIAARTEQVTAKNEQIVDYQAERKLFQERIEKLEARADRAGFLGDLKAALVGLLALVGFAAL